MGTHKPKLNRFQKGLYGFLYATVAPIYRRIIHYTPQDLSQAQPPYLVLANHNLTLDRWRWPALLSSPCALWPATIYSG